MKTCLIDVGGGMRGVYAAGVQDRCLDDGIDFDVCIGVSAGSANLSSFIAGQQGRSKRFYCEYSFRKEYMSLSNLIKKGSFFDLDYIYGTLSQSSGEDPLDYAAFVKNPAEFIVVAQEAQTGKAKYFTKADMSKDDYNVLKASSAIPFVCKPYEVNGVLYYDGALADPVPITKAFSLGCDKVVLILTKPKDLLRTPDSDIKLAKRIRKKYPQSADNIAKRAERYNRDVAIAKELEAAGRVLIIAPDDTCGVDTTKREKPSLLRLYEKGYADAAAIKAFLK